MTIRELYDRIGGNFDQAVAVMKTERLIDKYVRKLKASRVGETLAEAAETMDAVKLFEATKQWLWDRLGLEISPEKSKVVNLKRHASEFLGFQLKVRMKGKKSNGEPRYVIEAHM